MRSISLIPGDSVNRYSKGARGERELLNRLSDIGYSVIRSAGSGVNSISPDIIAVKGGAGLAFECKAWNKGSIAIEPEKFESLKRWRDNSGFKTFMAWRVNGKGWYFIFLDEMTRNEKTYSITRKTAESIGRKFENIIQYAVPEDR